MTKNEELLELIIRNNLISLNQLAEVKAEAAKLKKDPLDYILDKNIVEPESLVRVKADYYKLKYKNLTEAKIELETITFIPKEFAMNYKVICFEKAGNFVSVGVINPEDDKAMDAIRFLGKENNINVDIHLISLPSFNNAIKFYSPIYHEVSGELEKRVKEEEASVKKVEEKVKYDEVIKSAPVAKIVSVIMRHAVEGRASDIHIEPMAKETRIRYRIDGILNTSLMMPKEVHNSLVARVKVLSNLKLDETRIPQDGRIREVINGKEIDFRVSIIPLFNGEKVVMRILDITRGAPELETLGYMGYGLDIIKKNIEKTEGMFLVTGPTGSGKSTTLFSVLNRVNKEGINISTLEDPVEYSIKGVNQSQIRPEVGFTFAAGLRSLLRQDPDVIMVGEIRDNETAELAIHASLTGHFVLSTLHTNDSVGTIPRLLDMEVEPFLLSSTINCIIAQRLARKICDECKEPVELSPEIKENMKRIISGMPDDLLESYGISKTTDIIAFKGKGCSRCGQTGYSGRVAIAEVLDIENELRILIAEEKNINVDIVKKVQKFVEMREDGIIKVIKGMTTYEEILRVLAS